MADTFRLLFSALDITGTVQLWTTDGTATGTTELTAINNDQGGLHPEHITPFKTSAAFTGLDAAGLPSLWITDGTTTTELTPDTEFPQGLAPAALLPFGPSLLFTGTNTDGHIALWTTDSVNATELLALPDTGASIAPPQSLAWNGRAWFEIAGHLVASDGTPEGTTLLATGVTGPDDGPTIAGTDIGLLFSANNQLWRTDGTEAGTTPLSDATLAPTNLTRIQGSTLFRGTDSTGQSQIFATDGTQEGTIQLTTFTNAAPTAITPLGLGALFFARAADGTQHLWTTDGTPQGTADIATINDTPPTSILQAGPTVYFTTGGGLWHTDGTPQGTARISSATLGPGTALPDGSALFATPGLAGAIVATDGTSGGLSTLIPIPYASNLTLLSGTAPPLTNTTPPPCFLPGTHILTRRGEIPVECLTLDDHVFTRFHGWQPVRWIGRGQARIGHAHNHPARPVLIEPGALGDAIPSRPLAITQGHCLHFPDNDTAGHLVPAGLLVNGTSIRLQTNLRRVTYFHIALDHHDIILAENAACETWIDDGSPPLFDTTPPIAATTPCAPKSGYGPTSAAIWQALRARANLPPPAGPADPGLHLLADGTEVAPDFHRGPCYRFTLRKRPSDLLICSRSAVPAETGLAPDLRRLGVAIAGLQIAQHGILQHYPPEHPAFADGFHPPDPAGGPRWTTGQARIATPRLRLARGRLRLEINATGLSSYPVST